MKDSYETPLASRYASKEMLHIFSPDKKFSTWRKLWVALARAEMELGLKNADGTPTITPDMIKEMEDHIYDIDYQMAAEEEKKLRHDVMAHVHTYAAACPKAAGIIHLGATSCYVGDNTDIILMKEGLQLIHKRIINLLNVMKQFALEYKDMPTLGFTHFQAAQLVTVGKRATLWMNDLLMDLSEVEYRIDHLQLLGSKGTTGTQASFMELFDNDSAKVKELEHKIASEMGFREVVPVSGQTYSRKVDYAVLSTLSSIAQSASKFATDMRLLCHMKEIEEPFEKNQIGSSAMPYKRNPMRCERICSLARYVICDAENPAFTASSQWFERTLDDSANKRISVPEAFLATDAILRIYQNVASGLIVHDKVIQKHIMEELPFIASENIMMDAVKRGGNRQELHEEIRKMSIEAGRNVKEEGRENNLIDLIVNNPKFHMTKEEILVHMKPENYIGRCPQQVTEFIDTCVDPLLKKYAAEIDNEDTELSV